MELTEQGLTQREVADKLGVSIRTVGRDVKKLGKYCTYLLNKSHNELLKLWSRKIAEYSMDTRFILLTQLMLARDNPRRQNKLFWVVMAGNWKPSRGRW